MLVTKHGSLVYSTGLFPSRIAANWWTGWRSE